MALAQTSLLGTRRLLPLFITQFLGALNDNLFKAALVILIAFGDTRNSTQSQLMVSVATALFILPYFLFSGTAGQVADKFEKAGLIRWVKLWEIGVMLLAAAGFAMGSPLFGLFVLFLLGVQANFFGPLKYAILPELLAPEELMGGNALVEASTFLAILLGTIAGSLMILWSRGTLLVTLILLALAVAGYVASLFIPRGERADPELRINPNFLVETWRIVRAARANREVWLSILNISWFWAVGAVFLAQFPNFGKWVLGADNQVVTLFLVLFSVGIGTGSLLCGRLMRGELSARLAPWGAIGVTLFTLDLFWITEGHTAAGGELIGVGGFLALPGHWRMLFDLFAIALSGGFFAVPLYAILQARSHPRSRSRMVGANNIVNALFIVASGLIAAAMLAAHLSVPEIFLTFGLLYLGAVPVVARLTPARNIFGALATLWRRS